MSNRRNTIYLLIILCLTAGLFTGRSFFFNLAYLFGGLLIVSFIWAWLSVRWITIGRKTHPRHAKVGEDLEEVFTVHNTAILPKLWLELRDHSTLPEHRASHVVPAIGARGSYRWYVKTPCLIRGEFQLGPMTVSSGDPFGLYTMTRKQNANSRVIVYPQTLYIHKFEVIMGQLSGGDARKQRSPFVTTNASGIREYTHGDSFNRIHWASSARKNKLMVKEFELDPILDTWVIADFSQASLAEHPSLRRTGSDQTIIATSEEIPPSTEEYNVVIAATLTKHLADNKRKAGFITYAPSRQAYEPDRNNNHLSKIMALLATVRSKSTFTLAQMLVKEAPQFARGTTLIIITSSIDHNWIMQAQILAKRGIRPMCIFTDPATFDSAISSEETLAMLRVAKIPTIHIRKNDNLATALQRPAL